MYMYIIISIYISKSIARRRSGVNRGRKEHNKKEFGTEVFLALVGVLVFEQKPLTKNSFFKGTST